MITITIHPQTPEQIAVLATALTALLQPTEAAPAPAPAPTEDEQPKVRRLRKVEAPVVEAPVVEAPTAPTLVEVRAKLIALKEAGKGAQAKELLASRGFANLTVVPQDRYTEILTAAETL
jgi:hypothetical protein